MELQQGLGYIALPLGLTIAEWTSSVWQILLSEEAWGRQQQLDPQLQWGAQ